MQNSDPWLAMRAGDTENGLEQIREAHEKEPTPFHIMQLGVAYLWAQQYHRGFEHFRTAIERYPQSMSTFYGMAGAAKWCLGKADEAASEWAQGLEVRYADTNGLGIHLPLLLFVGSVVKPGSFDKELAKRILRDKAADPRAATWPGPIATWLLDEVSDREFDFSSDRPEDDKTCNRRWLAEFYRGVRKREHGEYLEFRNTMQRIVNTSEPEWSQLDHFLERIWGEEFYIARYEAVVDRGSHNVN